MRELPYKPTSFSEALTLYLRLKPIATFTAKSGDRRYRFNGAELASISGKLYDGEIDSLKLYYVDDGTYLVTYECKLRCVVVRYSKIENVEQELLDKLRSNMCEELKVKIPLADITHSISELPFKD